MTSLPSQTNQLTCATQTDYVSVSPSNDGVRKNADVFKKLGITQLVLGVLSMVFGTAILAYVVANNIYCWYNPNLKYSYYVDHFALISTGIWAGIFFLISGILGVLTGKEKTRFLNVSALVMTIFSALAAALLLVFEIGGAVSAKANYYDRENREKWMVSCAIHSTLSVIGFAEFVVSIVHSAYCCGAQCCPTPAQQAAQPMTYVYTNPAQQIPITLHRIQAGTCIQTGPLTLSQPGQLITTATLPQPQNNSQADEK